MQRAGNTRKEFMSTTGPLSRLRISGIALLSLSLVAGCNRDPNLRKQKYLDSGKRYEHEGKFREAAIQFLNALKVDRNYSEAHYELAKSYLHLGAADGALTELQRTVELSPANDAARIDLGGQLLLRGYLPQAAAQATAILAHSPASADAHALLSDVAYSQKDNARAVAELRTALALEPGRSAFHSSLGTLLAMSASTQKEAAAQMGEAISLDGGNLRARFEYASLLEKQGDGQGARAQLTAAIAAAPADASSRAALAGLLLRLGDAGDAESTLRKCAGDLPDSSDGASLFANYLISTGQLDRAASEYAALTAAHPKSSPLQLAYARTLVAKGDYGKAKEVARILSGGDQSDPEIAALNVAILRHDGKNDEAYDLLQRSLHSNPENAKLRILLGMVARDRGDLSLAQTSYREALSRDPRSLTAMRGLAEIANRNNDGGTLREVADDALAMYPRLPDGYVWKAAAEAGAAQLDLAAKDFESAIRLDPRNDQALAGLGEVRLKQNRTGDATALLSQAVAANPNSRALPLLVRLDVQGQQAGRAVSRIQEQIARSPNDADLTQQLAFAQLAANDPQGAIITAQRAMRMNPSDSNAMRAFTQAKIALGDLQPPIDLWQGWSKSHPRDAAGPAMLGMLYEAQDEPQKAIDAYQSSLQLQPDQPVASNNLAYLLIETGGNLDVALSLAQAAHRSMPDSPSTSDTLAWVYFQKGAYASAISLLQQAAAADPSSASVQYHLGMTLAKLNRKAEAADHLRKAAALAKDASLAKDAQRELQRLG